MIDEVHCFIAPKIIGGAGALTPIAGRGVAEISAGMDLDQIKMRTQGTDVYVTGRRIIDNNQMGTAQF
jgi:diaminohydroxyphosphoribosylaminopyrimidine deaminase/5-amino-6-(5-phosphoribosylamino)uracil reductase